MVIETRSSPRGKTMQLTEVVPSSTVAGFGCTMTRNAQCLVAGSQFETLFIDHFLRLAITNDGSNENYPHPFKLSFLMTQYVELCNVDIDITKSDTPACVVILKPSETLEKIRLAEVVHPEHTSVITIIWIKDRLTKMVSTQGWGLATSGHRTFQSDAKRKGNKHP